MRTTLNLDDHLMAEAKAMALQSKQTLTSFIEDAIRQVILKKRGAAPRSPFATLTYGKGGVRAGLDLADNAAVRDLMDEP